MADESLGQRKRNAIVAGTLLEITLIASLASILPFLGVTSVGQLGIAVGRIGARYSQGLNWLAGYTGIIGFIAATGKDGGQYAATRRSGHIQRA